MRIEEEPSGTGTGGRRVARNFSVLFAANVTGQLLALGGLVYLGRIVGPAAFGLWNLALTWVLYAHRAGELGLEVIGIRVIASAAGATAHVAGSVVAVRLLLAAGIYGIIVLLALQGAFPAGVGLLVMILSLTVFSLSIQLEWIYEAFQRVTVVAAMRVLKGALFAGLLLFTVDASSDLPNAAWWYWVSVSVPAGITLVLAARRFGLRMDASTAREGLRLLRTAAPVGLATILVQYSFFVGTVIVGSLMSSVDLGHYTAAHRLVVFLWAYGIVTSNRVLLPQLSRLHAESAEGFRRMVVSVFRMLVLVSMPVGLVAAVGGPGAITWLLGGEYGPSGSVLQLLGVALVAAIVRSPLEVALIASNRQGIYTRAIVGLALLYTVTTLVAVSRWGIVGAGWAAVISEITCTLFVIWSYRTTPTRDLVYTLAVPLVCGGASAGLLLTLGWTSPWLAATMGTLGYLGLLGSVGWLRWEDWRAISRLFPAGR